MKVFKFENNELIVTDERIEKNLLNGLNFSEIKDWKNIIFQYTQISLNSPSVLNTPKNINTIKTIRRKSYFNDSSKTNAK
jgi:hypothetical protein